jgi:hypothetical protein
LPLHEFTLIFIIYVDDILLYGKCNDEINDFIARMKSEDVALHQERTAEGYLGVYIYNKKEVKSLSSKKD